jgi:hypothetical protein
MLPNVWTAMGHVIVTGPSTPRQTGPRLRLPGPPRAPQGSHATHSHPEARSRHSHPFALPEPSRCSKTCGLPWGTLLLQVPPHPNKRDHGCGGGRELPMQTLLSRESVFKEGPIDSFSTFSSNRIFSFSTHHYLRRRLRRLTQAGLAINDNGGIVRFRRDRPLYAVSEVTFLWRARENLPEKVVFFFFAAPIVNLIFPEGNRGP